MGFRRSKRGLGRRRIDLKKTLFVVPNLITLAAVFCGFNAIRIVATDAPTHEDIHRAAILLLFAMLFDMLDGRVARMTKTQSAFGLQLDSLADIISFGLAPSLLVYKWVLYRHPTAGLLTAFLFVACAAVRLARFNVLSSSSSGAPVKPGKYIIGLPTPPASGVLISLIVANSAVGGAIGAEQYTLVIFAVTIVVSLLMVSNVRFRSFKELRLNPGTVGVVVFTLGSGAFIWQRFTLHFVLLWLLSVYLLLGIAESLSAVAQYLRKVPARESAPPAPSMIE